MKSFIAFLPTPLGHAVTAYTLLGIYKAAAQMPDPAPGNSPFYVWFYRIVHTLLTNFSQAGISLSSIMALLPKQKAPAPVAPPAMEAVSSAAPPVVAGSSLTVASVANCQCDECKAARSTAIPPPPPGVQGTTAQLNAAAIMNATSVATPAPPQK